MEEPPIEDIQHSANEKETPAAKALQDVFDELTDTNLPPSQHRANMARVLAKQSLEVEVKRLTGEQYSRKSDGNSLRRWGTNPGSIRTDGAKLLIGAPRVRDTDAGEERPFSPHFN